MNADVTFTTVMLGTKLLGYAKGGGGWGCGYAEVMLYQPVLNGLKWHYGNPVDMHC